MWQKKEDEFSHFFHQVHSPHTLLILFISPSLPLSVSPLTLDDRLCYSEEAFFFFFYTYQQGMIMMLISLASLLFIDVIVCHWRSIEIRNFPSLNLSYSLPTGRTPVVQSTHPCGAVESSVIGMLGQQDSLHFETADTWDCVCVCFCAISEDDVFRCTNTSVYRYFACI